MPRIRTRIIRRQRLFDVLWDRPDAQLVIVAAPTGYGKTTLLATWSQVDPRPFAWVNADLDDADPSVLLADCVAALSAAGVIEGRPHRGSAMTVADFAESVLDAEPFVLVVDDAHAAGPRALKAAVSLSDQLPSGAQLALISRVPVPERLAKRRAAGTLLELTTADLALDDGEIRWLLNEMDADLSMADDREMRATEGWPAAVYLMALAARHAMVTTSDRHAHQNVVELVREEALEGQSDGVLELLYRISVLDQFSAPLCDAVLGDVDSGEILNQLARSTTLLIPLDERPGWWRLHALLRDTLRSELNMRDPRLARELRRRADQWFEARGPAPEDVTSDAPPDAAAAATPRMHPATATFDEPITEAEMRILRLLATPMSQREISNQLHISQNTVKSHKRSIFQKMAVHSRAAAVAAARCSGIL